MRRQLLLLFVLLPAACNLPWNTAPKSQPAGEAPAESQAPARLTAAESPEAVDPNTAAARQQIEDYVATFAEQSSPTHEATGDRSSHDTSVDHVGAAQPLPTRPDAALARGVPPAQAGAPSFGDRATAASTVDNSNPTTSSDTTLAQSTSFTPTIPDSTASAAAQPATEGSTASPPAVIANNTPPPAPPRLLAASVAPAPAARFNAEASTSASPNRPARHGAAQSVADRIAELERTVADNPNDLEAQLRLRLLQLADGRDAQAAAPTPGMTRELEETVLAAVRVLAAARTGAGRDPAQWANRQLDAVEAYAALVRRQADLLVPRVALCREALSYGVYDEIDPPRFAAGRPTTVLVYVEVAHLRDEPTADDRRRTRLSVRLSILDRSGQEVWSHLEENMEDVCRSARRDFFVAIDLSIPTSLNPGRYTLKAAVTDAIGLRTNEGRTEFELFAP